ncbi:MAG: endonuclease/exonuclease/phosphatase family protein [Roseiflexaceae bacterium]
MSFNLRYSTAPDGENRWELRKELALARIHAYAPDLLGLQECQDNDQARFVKAQLPNYHFAGVRRSQNGNADDEIAPVLVEQSMFQLIETGHFWLSETPHVIGSKHWGSAFPRTVTWAKLLHLPTGRPLMFVNTHFDYQPPAVAASAVMFHPWLVQAQQELPVILTGDFNADKESSAYRLMTGADGLCDAYRQVHPHDPSESTFHGFGQSAALQPIDWILVSRHFTAISATIDRTSQGRLFPSDHYPVLAELVWRD